MTVMTAAKKRTTILFVDDMKVRHTTFRKLVEDLTVVVISAWSCDQAIDMMKVAAFDVVLLDHDLNEDDIMIEPGAPTKTRSGMDIVRWMTDPNSLINRATPIVVHTLNDPAGTAMVAALRDGGFQPTRARITQSSMIRSLIEQVIVRQR